MHLNLQGDSFCMLLVVLHTPIYRLTHTYTPIPIYTPYLLIYTLYLLIYTPYLPIPIYTFLCTPIPIYYPVITAWRCGGSFWRFWIKLPSPQSRAVKRVSEKCVYFGSRRASRVGVARSAKSAP